MDLARAPQNIVCKRGKKTWQLTEHAVTEQGDTPIHYPPFCVSLSPPPSLSETHTQVGTQPCANGALVSLSHAHKCTHSLDKKHAVMKLLHIQH